MKGSQSASLVQDSVKQLLLEEVEIGLDQYRYYLHFGAKVESIRGTMQSLLADLRSKNKRIAAYGAAAKGTIMLNYIGAGRDTIEFVVDRNVHKQGKWMPGVRIPILAPDELLTRLPDYALILPWNFKDEILEQQAAYRARGGKFIIPIPEPNIV